MLFVSGSALKKAFLAMSNSVHNLAAATSAELQGSLPAFGDKLMCCRKSYVQQGEATDGTHQVSCCCCCCCFYWQTES